MHNYLIKKITIISNAMNAELPDPEESCQDKAHANLYNLVDQLSAELENYQRASEDLSGTRNTPEEADKFSVKGIGSSIPRSILNIAQIEAMQSSGSDPEDRPLATAKHHSYNVGNSNYAEKNIQPWFIWLEYALNPWDADIVKRILRTKTDEGMSPEESRIMDYTKIKHLCDERAHQISIGDPYYTNMVIPPWVAKED